MTKRSAAMLNEDRQDRNGVTTAKVSTLLLTFDHELYLGARSGSVRRCFLDPTEALRAILNRHGMRRIVFVDALHLARLGEGICSSPRTQWTM